MNELIQEATTTIEDNIVIIETTILEVREVDQTILDNREIEINLVIEEIEVLVEVMVIIETVTIEVTIITVTTETIIHRYGLRKTRKPPSWKYWGRIETI